VKELIDEVPVRVKMTKQQAAIEDAFRNGERQGRTDAARMLQKQYLDEIEVMSKDLEAQAQQHKASQVNLIHTFAGVIFMLGKSEAANDQEK